MSEAIDEHKVLVFTGGEVSATGNDWDLLGDTPGGVTTVGALRLSVREFMPGLGAVMNDVKETAVALGLQEVEVALGINAKGKIGFLGTGSEVGGDASLKLKFKI
jgi:hypothetical protein